MVLWMARMEIVLIIRVRRKGPTAQGFPVKYSPAQASGMFHGICDKGSRDCCAKTSSFLLLLPEPPVPPICFCSSVILKMTQSLVQMPFMPLFILYVKGYKNLRYPLMFHEHFFEPTGSAEWLIRGIAYHGFKRRGVWSARLIWMHLYLPARKAQNV